MTHKDGLIDADVLRGSAPTLADGQACDVQPGGECRD